MTKLFTILLAGLALACSGCVSDHYESTDGVKHVAFSRTAFGTKQAIKSATINVGTGEVKITGYGSDPTETVAAIASGVADAVAKAVSPKP